MSPIYVKICPLCQHSNPALASFCSECDADLMNVSVTLPPSAETKETNNVTVAAQTAITPVAAMPVPPRGDANDTATMRIDGAEGHIVLELVANPAIKFRIGAGQSVGRSNRADVVLTGVPELDFISRSHARFSKRRTQWYVQYIAEGNSITVDGTESRDDSELAIYEGSLVVLSFTAFRIKLN